MLHRTFAFAALLFFGVRAQAAQFVSLPHHVNERLATAKDFTAVPSNGLGFLSTWPTGMAQPVVSTLNAQITANAAMVTAGTGGAISVYASNDAHLVVDVNGYFAPPAANGLSF